MRSNKKGYTLIEIVVCILLITLIGTISVIVVKKDEKTNEELKSEFVEAIKLDAAVYVESNKEKFISVMNGYWEIIRFNDLIDSGLLDENKFNPERNVKSGEFNDCVRVFLDGDSNVDIEYPATICEGKTEEEIKESLSLSNSFIKLKNNNEVGNKFILPSSIDMLSVIDKLVEKKTYKSSYAFYEALKKGDYNTYSDPGYYLADASGNIIPTTDDDWCITKEKVYSDKNKKNWDSKWKYTYDICEDSSIYNVYKNVNSENNVRIVEMIDNDAPVLLSESDNHEFVSGVDYFYALDKFYYGYLDFGAMYYYNQSYYVYDNYDGASYDVLERLSSLNFTYDLSTKDLLLEDSNNNERTYEVHVTIAPNIYPGISYEGSTSLYENDTSYSNGELQPFYNNIVIHGNGCELLYTKYYLYSNNAMYDNEKMIDNYGNTYYHNSYTQIIAGFYTLYIEACNKFFNCSYASYKINIDNYIYSDTSYNDNYNDYGHDDYYCGDPCILEQMRQNSEAWWHSSPEEQDRLHQENESLARQLSGDTYYTGDGYWHNSDGSLLYGSNSSYDGYGYGDYGYNYR